MTNPIDALLGGIQTRIVFLKSRLFQRGIGPGGFRMMGHGAGLFFSPLMSLGHILFWVLAIWFVYWLFTRSGWKLSLTRHAAEAPKAEPVAAEKTE